MTPDALRSSLDPAAVADAAAALREANVNFARRYPGDTDQSPPRSPHLEDPTGEAGCRAGRGVVEQSPS